MSHVSLNCLDCIDESSAAERHRLDRGTIWSLMLLAGLDRWDYRA